MKQFLKLIDVKSIVTLVLTITFVVLSVMGVISGDRFYAIYIMIISFYFGTQYQKKESENKDDDGRNDKRYGG